LSIFAIGIMNTFASVTFSTFTPNAFISTSFSIGVDARRPTQPRSSPKRMSHEMRFFKSKHVEKI
jgi:hypothetical protein